MADIFSALMSSAGAGGGGFKEGYKKFNIGTNQRNQTEEYERTFVDSEGNVYSLSFPTGAEATYANITKYSTSTREYIWYKRLSVARLGTTLPLVTGSSAARIPACLAEDGFYVGFVFYSPSPSYNAVHIGFYKFNLEDGSIDEYDVRYANSAASYFGQSSSNYAAGIVVMDNGGIALTMAILQNDLGSLRSIAAIWDQSRTFYAYVFVDNSFGAPGPTFKYDANSILFNHQSNEYWTRLTVNTSSVTRNQTFRISYSSVSNNGFILKPGGGYYIVGRDSFFDTQMRYVLYILEYNSSWTKVGEQYFTINNTAGNLNFNGGGATFMPSVVVDDSNNPKYLMLMIGESTANNYNYLCQIDISSTISSSTTMTSIRTKNTSNTNSVSLQIQNSNLTTTVPNQNFVTRQWSGDFANAIDFFNTDLNNFTTTLKTYESVTNVERGTYFYGPFAFQPGYTTRPFITISEINNSPTLPTNRGSDFSTVTVVNTLTDQTYTIATGDI